MNRLTKALFVAASAVAFATGASAAIVCDEEGDCWHVKERHEYRPEFKVRVYPDDWRWAESEGHKYRWREHEGRGYWREGVWVEF